mgnify:CR=1 FL=1
MLFRSLIAMKALVWPGETKKGEDYLIEEIPANLKAKADEARHQLIETLAESDDTVMEKYLEGAELSEDEIIAGIRRATLAAKAVPVLTGSAFKNKGVQPMLDAVVRYLPSPLDVEAIVGHNVADSSIEVIRKPSESEPMSDRKSTRLNSSHSQQSRMPSSA